FELLLCHGTVCVVGKIRDLILQLSKSSIYSTKPVAARKYWLENMKGISRVEHLLRRINEGLVDPLEADRIIPLDEDERLSIDDV
ncbi:hypothetical protein ACRW7A_17980, partial [Escherichia coli]